MALATNVSKRKGTSNYIVRVAIPQHLREHFPSRDSKSKSPYRSELTRSAGTSDPKLAKTRMLEIRLEWQRRFDELDRRRQIATGDFRNAAWGHYSAELEHDRRDRLALPSKADIEADRQAGRLDAVDAFVMQGAAQFAKDQRTGKLAELKRHLAEGEVALIKWAADAFVARENLLIVEGSADYRELCQSLQRAEIEALERTLERDGGDWAGVPRDPLIAPADVSQGQRIAPPGETIMELYDRFEIEQKGSVTKDTWVFNRKIVGLFVDFLGECSHVSAFNRKAVRDWKHMLMKWPVKATASTAFAGMSFRQIIEANETVKKPTIAQNTVNRHLSAIASFSTWLFKNEYIDQDAADGMFLSINKREKKRFPFSDDQLKVIFASPLFRTCSGDKKEHLPGKAAIRDWRYWIPWIGLYTGARLGEIAQLLTADVKQMHGIWVFHITREGSDLKSTKTDGSQRIVPVHSKLIELGFIKYHQRMLAAGEKQLFPEMVPDGRGFFSSKPSRFLNKYLRQIGVKEDKRVNVHSFRHTIADAFRRAGYLDEQFKMLLGHTAGTTTGRYGIEQEGPLKQRAEIIEAVAFELGLSDSREIQEATIKSRLETARPPK